jgi:hypothetical protein
MVILCSFKQDGIEGYMSPGGWQLQALTGIVGSGPSTPRYFLDPLNQQLPQNKGEKYDR